MLKKSLLVLSSLFSLSISSFSHANVWQLPAGNQQNQTWLSLGNAIGPTYSLQFDSAGHLFAGTQGTLYELNAQSQWVAKGSGLPNGDIDNIQFDSQGDIFVGFSNTAGGVYELPNRNDQSQWEPIGGGIGTLSPDGLIIDKKGNLYVANSLNGVAELSSPYISNWQPWGTGLSAQLNRVYSLQFDTQGNLYVSGFPVSQTPATAVTIAKLPVGFTSSTAWIAQPVNPNNNAWQMTDIKIDSKGDIFAIGYAGAYELPVGTKYWQGLSNNGGESMNGANYLQLDNQGNIYAGMNLSAYPWACPVVKYTPLNGAAWLCMGNFSNQAPAPTQFANDLQFDTQGNLYLSGY